MRRSYKKLSYFNEGVKALVKRVVESGGSVRVIPDTAYTEVWFYFPMNPSQPQVLRLRGSYKEIEQYISTISK